MLGCFCALKGRKTLLKAQQISIKSRLISQLNMTPCYWMTPRHWQRLLCLFLLVAVVGSAPAAAQQQLPVQISLPDLTGEASGTTITVPITLDSPVQASANVAGYTIKVTYDPAVIDITGADENGTLTDGWSTTVNTMNADRIIVSGANATALSASSGVLLNLQVDVLSDGSTALGFTSDTSLGDFSNGGDLDATGGNLSAGNALVITEVFADPASGPDGDANNDGTSDNGDPFVEIVNTGSASIDLTGYTLADEEGTVLHTFGAIALEPGIAAVVFAGGTPTGINGEVVTASGALNLNDSGGTVELNDNAGARVDGATWGGELSDEQSVTRAPGFTDAFEQHTLVGNGAQYSPGTDPNGGALPVELVNFVVTPDGHDVVLRWSTASETGNKGFAIEQSTGRSEAGTFREVAFVDGAGTSTQLQSYSHTLRGLAPGTYQFRLRQDDVDGTSSYSVPRSVEIDLNGAFLLRPSGPNPFRSRTTFELQVRETQPVQVALYNVLGQRVKSLFAGTLRGGAQPQSIAIDGTGLASGVYFYRITGRTFDTSGRVTRVR